MTLASTALQGSSNCCCGPLVGSKPMSGMNDTAECCWWVVRNSLSGTNRNAYPVLSVSQSCFASGPLVLLILQKSKAAPPWCNLSESSAGSRCHRSSAAQSFQDLFKHAGLQVGLMSFYQCAMAPLRLEQICTKDVHGQHSAPTSRESEVSSVTAAGGSSQSAWRCGLCWTACSAAGRLGAWPRKASFSSPQGRPVSLGPQGRTRRDCPPSW